MSPDSLLWYAQTATPIHNAPEDAGAVTGLISASPEEERAFIDGDPNENVVARRIDLVQVLRRFRCARFRPAVLRAYSYRCAVCGGPRLPLRAFVPCRSGEGRSLASRPLYSRPPIFFGNRGGCFLFFTLDLECSPDSKSDDRRSCLSPGGRGRPRNFRLSSSPV